MIFIVIKPNLTAKRNKFAIYNIATALISLSGTSIRLINDISIKIVVDPAILINVEIPICSRRISIVIEIYIAIIVIRITVWISNFITIRVKERIFITVIVFTAIRFIHHIVIIIVIRV